MARTATSWARVGAAAAGLAAALTAALTAGPAMAAGVTETQYIFNTLSFLMHGFLVMWMAAGFAMLESGLVRSKNTAAICLKNLALYAIAGLMYFIVGYNLKYDGVDGGFAGSFSWWIADNSRIR